MMGRSRESRRAPAAAAITSARVTPVVAILLLASALPGALASDYEGDYALYSGHHAKCSSVMYGVSQPEVQVPSANTAFRDDSIFYARFHVRTPYRFLPERPSDHSGSQPNSTTYNLFVFGGSDAYERGCDGWFGGVEADPNDSKRGYLFFGHRNCSTGALTKYVGTERWVWNGESTRVEFSYFRANSTLRMYVDGELTYENFAASLPEPSSDHHLSIGVGGHASTSSTIDAWDSGGCFSPNVPNWSPRDGARPDAEPECETRNRWDEIDGGDLLWCPSGWTGAAPSPKPVQPSRAAFKPSDGGCDAQLFAPRAPMYTKDSSEAWQRNRLRTKYAADPTKVDLRDLGEYPDFEDKFVYARFSFTTPEYFGRPHHSWGGYVEDQDMGDYARGKIRLFGMGNHESLMGPSPQDNRFASCVSLVAVSPPGVPPDAHIRQMYNRSKIVIHECSEAKFNGGEIYAKNFEVTSSYLEPSTSYLLEIKFNYRSSERTVDVYLQGRMVASGPFDFFPCKRTARSDLGCDLSQDSNYPHSVWFGDNAPLSYSFPPMDVNHWPGVVSAGNPGEVFTFMTDWGGNFSRAWSADGDPTDDWACVHDGKCGYLTGAQGTWGNWTSGELHFCPYPSDAPVAPTFDRDMYVATHACENCFPADKSLGSGVLIGPFVGLTDADSIADDRLFRVVSATMSGEDGPARVARFFSHTGQPAQQQFCEAWAQDLSCYAVDDQSQCASSPSSTCQWHWDAGSGWCGTSGEAEETLRHYLDARPRRYGEAFEACNGMSGDPTACDADSECEYISSWNSCEPTRTALEAALKLDGASEGAVAYHSLFHHECRSHEEESVCVADNRCQYETGKCKLRDEYWFTLGANACVDTSVDFRVVAQSYNTTLKQAFVDVGVPPARGVLSEDYPLAIGTASYIVWTCDADARELKMVKVTFRDRDGVVRAVADGASTWSSADSNVDDDEFCNLRDYVVNERWEDASSASTPTSIATGRAAQGLGVSSIVVEAYLPVEVFSTTPNDFDTFAKTGNGTSLRDPRAMPVMGVLAGGGLRGEHGGSIVHVMDANEASAACDAGTSGRRRALLQKRREPTTATMAAAAAGKKTERARRRRAIESSTRRPTTTTATTRTPSRNARGRALLQSSSYSWPSQDDACAAVELSEYCKYVFEDSSSCPSPECSWDSNSNDCVPADAMVKDNEMAFHQLTLEIYMSESSACVGITSNGDPCDTTAGCVDRYGYCLLSEEIKLQLVEDEVSSNIAPGLAVTVTEVENLMITCASYGSAQDCQNAGCTAVMNDFFSPPEFSHCEFTKTDKYETLKTACQGTTGTGTYYDALLSAIGGGGGGGSPSGSGSNQGSNSDSLYDSLIARYAGIPYYSVADMCAAWEIQVFCFVTSKTQAECSTHSECQWGLRSINDDDSECLADNPTFNSTYVEMQWKIRSLHADQDNICRQRSSSECTSDADCAFMSHWGNGGECAASYSFITDAVANDGAPLHIQTFAELDNLDRLCEPLAAASCDYVPGCSYDSDRGSCETDEQYYIGNALSTDACDSYADFSLILAAFSDSGSPTPQPPEDSVVGSTLWETSTNFTELTDAVGLVATCDYPFDDADLSGEGTMKMVLFNLTHDGARTLVKPLKAGEKANVAGCHYKVHDVDEVTAAWKCRTSAELATTAFTPDAFSLRTITYLKSSFVSTRPYSRSDVEEAALEGVCDPGCASDYVKHGFLDVA